MDLYHLIIHIRFLNAQESQVDFFLKAFWFCEHVRSVAPIDFAFNTMEQYTLLTQGKTLCITVQLLITPNHSDLK